MQQQELQLVLEAVGGNADSFGRLAEGYGPTILGLVYTVVGDIETARDITQEAFLKAYTSLSSLQRADRFGSWLRQIAVNLAKSHLRRGAGRSQVPLDDRDARQEEGPAVERTVERSLMRQEMLQLLQSVPEGPRVALVMHYLVGLSPAEAALRLGISRSAFDTRLSRGRETLRRELTLLMDSTLSQAKEQLTVYLTGITDRVKATLQTEQRERVAAAKELALLAARANLPRLVRDLKSPDEGIRKTAAQLMGDTQDHRTGPSLLEALLQEENGAVQAELCRNLTRVGYKEAVPALQKLSRNTADMNVLKAAADAAKALAEAVAAEGETGIPVELDDLKAAGIEALLLTLLVDESPAVRVHAAEGLGRVESAKALAPLTESLQADPQPYVRRAAAEALGAILWLGRTGKDRPTAAQRSKAVRALADALLDSDMAVQAEAAYSLTHGASPGDAYVLEKLYTAVETAILRPGPWFVAFPPLWGALGSEEDRVKVAQLLQRPSLRWKGPFTEAVLSLSRPGQYAANPLIIEAISQGLDPNCTWKLVRALGTTRDPAVLPFLQTLVVEKAPKVREEAALAIAGYPEGRQLLRTIIDTCLDEPAKHEGTVLAAAGALAQLGQQDEAAYLETVAASLSPRAQISVRAAARRLCLG